MQPRVPVPGLMHPEPAHQYRMSGDMGFARASWPHPQGGHPHAQPQVGRFILHVHLLSMMRWQQESVMEVGLISY